MLKRVIEIDGLTEAQALALEDVLAMWHHLGALGSSRWTAFFADGDGNFRPKITIDGRRPQAYTKTDAKRRWVTLWRQEEHGMNPIDVYMMDFDEIAWQKHKP